ncbi:hypothetical protein HPP92_017702 [Vanilla planifolia]|uniref:Uncharacterized protein n=1 Tax=Vanilla planifolia TaxID=51239 RepID=A0A835QE68_VANPL|nr:hypothetical protein HPP92_017702 [Vanilla planifolia]
MAKKEIMTTSDEIDGGDDGLPFPAAAAEVRDRRTECATPNVAGNKQGHYKMAKKEILTTIAEINDERISPLFRRLVAEVEERQERLQRARALKTSVQGTNTAIQEHWNSTLGTLHNLEQKVAYFFKGSIVTNDSRADELHGWIQ